MSSWQNTLPDGGCRRHICFCLRDKCVFYFILFYFFVVVFIYRISEYMDLTPAEVVGQTCYHFIHVEDLENLRQSHEDCESHPYAYVVYEFQPHPL